MSSRKAATPVQSGKTTGKTAGKTTGKAPVAKRVAAKPNAARAKPPGALAPEERQRFIAEAAYFRAERRGFAEGGDLDDWIEAEAEIDTLLNSSRGAA